MRFVKTILISAIAIYCTTGFQLVSKYGLAKAVAITLAGSTLTAFTVEVLAIINKLNKK